MTQKSKNLTHSDVVKAIEGILSSLSRDGLNAASSVEDFTKWFLLKKNKFIIYVGAGASKTITVRGRKLSKDWRELLIEMYKSLRDVSSKDPLQRQFLESATARAGKLKIFGDRSLADLEKKEWRSYYKSQKDDIAEEVLDKLGPIKFAWSLRWFFEKNLDSTAHRDKIIDRIVNVARGADLSDVKSPLLSEMVRLPFREIITTNYDHNIEIFLEKTGKEPVPVFGIKSLTESFQKFQPRLFYLHGKAREDHVNLIFDKYDYAHLYTKNHQIIDYVVTLLLRYGVLFVGFALDDLTFDYMESKLRAFVEDEQGKVNVEERIPESYSFMREIEISDNEIKALKELFNIRVIKFREFDDVPKVLKSINTIVSYMDELQIQWLSDKNEQEERVKQHYETATIRFLKGDLEESLDYYRAALAHTTFWTIDRDGDPKDPKEQWNRFQFICEIRRRLSLTRSRLRWNSNNIPPNNDVLIDKNLSEASQLIQQYRQRYFEAISAKNKKQIEEELIVEEIALKMLDARILYHRGEFIKSINKFDIFNPKSDVKKHETALDLVEQIKDKLRRSAYKPEKYEIRLLETYYFAQCQIDRAAAILSQPVTVIDIKTIAEETREIHEKLRQTRNLRTKEEVLRVKEFGTVSVIAQWSRAIDLLRDFTRFMDESRKTENIRELDEIARILEAGYTYAEAKSCKPSPRWEAVYHRTMCRIKSLQWFNDHKNSKLLEDAHKSINQSLELTSNKVALEAQHIRNLIETVRLILISNYGSIIFYHPQDRSVTPLSFAVSKNHLTKTFEMFAKLLPNGEADLKQNLHVWWLLIQAYEITAYWKLIFNDYLKKSLDDIKNEWLRKFLNKDSDNFLQKNFRDFGRSVAGDKKITEKRIQSFERVFQSVKDKLQSCKAEL